MTWVASIYESNIFKRKSQHAWSTCLTTCLIFLIKLDMASQTLKLPEMDLSQFCTQSIFGNNGTYIYCVLEWNWRASTMVGACVKFFFKSLELLHYLKNELFSWSKSFYKSFSKKVGLSIRVPYWFIDKNMQHYKFQQTGY